MVCYVLGAVPGYQMLCTDAFAQEEWQIQVQGENAGPQTDMSLYLFLLSYATTTLCPDVREDLWPTQSPDFIATNIIIK